MGKDNDQSCDGKDGRPRIETDGLLDRLQEHGGRARLHEQDRDGPVIIEQPKG